MVLGTYANLNAIDEKSSGGDEVIIKAERPFYRIDHLPDHLDKSVEITTMVDVKNVTEYLQQPPKLIVEAVNPKHHSNKLIAARPSISETQPEIKPSSDVVKPNQADINREAILHEDAEIAAEAKSDLKNDELQKTNKLVKEIKDELVKKQKETENLVMQKLGALAEHIEHIEQVQENELSKAKHDQKVVKNDQISELKLTPIKERGVENKVSASVQHPVNQSTTTQKKLSTNIQNDNLNVKHPVISLQPNDPFLTRLEEASHKKAVIIDKQKTKVDDKQPVIERTAVRDILNVKDNQVDPNGP